MRQAPTWDELLASLNDKAYQLDEKGWNIYRYLSANIGDGLSSEEARTLLLVYMKLSLTRPSLLHSMMLGVALRMTEIYADFRFPDFLKLWDVRNLRAEDSQRQQNEQGRVFRSLAERLAKCIVRYVASHPSEPFDSQAMAFAGRYFLLDEACNRRIGYVDYFDEMHQYYHIFDSDSRHFVAESPKIRPVVGGYVWFSPIVPVQDKFKSAIVHSVENVIDGRQAFGIATAHVTIINNEKEYFGYQTEDGRSGYAYFSISPRPLAVGDEVRLILFMRRCKDGEKRLHVAEML